MSFGTAVRVCFSKYADFSGRARRAEFWWFYLALNLLSLVLLGIPYVLLVIALISAADNDSGRGASELPGLFWVALVLLAIGSLASLATALPMYAVMARRLHDTGQSGHWVWLALAGLGIVPLIMCAMEGNAYPNQYGPDPKAGEHPAGAYVAPHAYAAQPAYPVPPTYAAPPAAPTYAAPTYAEPPYAQPGYPTPPAAPTHPAPPAPPAP